MTTKPSVPITEGLSPYGLPSAGNAPAPPEQRARETVRENASGLSGGQDTPGAEIRNPQSEIRNSPDDPFDPDVLDKIIRLLCNIQDRATVVSACLTKIGLSPEHVDAAIDAAKEKLTRAAAFHKDHELGRAITRLNELYQRSVTMQDVKSAIAAQRELNRLLGLYPAPQLPPEPGAGDEDERQRQRSAGGYDAVFAAIDVHLEPLALTASETDGYEELIALAADEIVRLRALQTPPKVRSRRKAKSTRTAQEAGKSGAKKPT